MLLKINKMTKKCKIKELLLNYLLHESNYNLLEKHCPRLIKQDALCI